MQTWSHIPARYHEFRGVENMVFCQRVLIYQQRVLVYYAVEAFDVSAFASSLDS